MTDTLARMRQLVGTTAQWAADDLAIGDGELAAETLPDGASLLRIGNGSARFSQLPPISGGFLQSGAGAVVRSVQDRLREEVHLLDFGGAADGVADCTGAFRAAYAELVRRIGLRAASRAGGRLVLPAGSVRITDEINLWRPSSPRMDIEIVGQGQLATQILVDFYGASKAALRSEDPAGVARASPISFRGFRMDCVGLTGGITPVHIAVLGWGEASMEDVRLGGTNNSAVRLASAQNCRFWNVNAYGGGRSFNYKRTAGITFSVETTTKTITASAAIFSAADVGKYLFIFPATASRRIRYLIGAVADSTHASYTDANGLVQTNEPGWFEPARCSMAAGSSTLTANANVFTADMVGLVLYVRAARAGPYGPALLRGRVTAVPAANQATLSVPADVAVSDQFFGVAAFDLGLPPGQSGSSDVKAVALRIEHYLGVGLVAQNTDSWDFIGCKMHGEPTASDDRLANAAFWLDDFGGSYQGELDTTCSMADWRVHFCNANDTASIVDTTTRGIINGQVFGSDLVTNAGGYLSVRDLTSYAAPGDASAGDPYALVADANYAANPADPRIIITGFSNMLADVQKPRIYVGRGTYFTPDGVLRGARKAPLRDIPSAIVWNGTPPGGTKAEKYSWTQIDNVVNFRFRLKYVVPGVGNSTLVVGLPADMPAPSTDASGSDEILGANVAGTMSATANGTPALCKSFMIGNGAGGYQFDVILNSSTVAATFAIIAGFYFTA